MKEITRIYVAGPIGGLDATYMERQHNIINAAQVAVKLMRMGYNPYCPHTHNANFCSEMPEFKLENWLRLDFEFLRLCHALFRLPGFSVGSDREVSEAHRLGIPVFYRLHELQANVPVLTEIKAE